MKRILVIAGVLLSLTACKFGEENQSVKIDTPKEIKQKEKKPRLMLPTRILKME